MSTESAPPTANPGQTEQPLQVREEQARALPITGSWFKPFRGAQVLELGIVNGDSVGGIRGALAIEGPLRGQVEIQRVEVFSPDNRGKGLGRRLLQTFTAEAKQAGATTLVGDIISAEEIHNRVNTFGDENVTFFEKLPAADGHNGGEIELPLTRQQAIESLQRAEQAYNDRHAGEEDPEEPEPTIGARTDLTTVDTSAWELPLIKEGSMRPNLSEHQAAVSQQAGSLALAGPR